MRCKPFACRLTRVRVTVTSVMNAAAHCRRSSIGIMHVRLLTFDVTAVNHVNISWCLVTVNLLLHLPW